VSPHVTPRAPRMLLVPVLHSISKKRAPLELNVKIPLPVPYVTV